jgi:hypothetical protein
VAAKVAEVQNMARHVLRNAQVLWLSGQHLNRPCKSGEATKATGKQKWPTLRNVGIRYRSRHPNRRVATRCDAVTTQLGLRRELHENSDKASTRCRAATVNLLPYLTPLLQLRIGKATRGRRGARYGYKVRPVAPAHDTQPTPTAYCRVRL